MRDAGPYIPTLGWRAHRAFAALAGVLLLTACGEDPAAAVRGGDASSSADAKGDTATAKPKPLTVGSVTPATGSLQGGEELDIEGTGFASNCQVLIGDTPAEVTWRAGSTHVYVTAPARTAAGQVDVTVVNPSGNAATPGKKQTFTLPRSYTYLGEVAVHSFSPGFGSFLGGESITVRGSGFVPGDRVLVALQEALHTQWVDAQTLVAVVPPLGGVQSADVVPVQVSVRHSSGLSHATGSFTYGRPPRLDSVAPSVLGVAGGDVTLQGAGLGQITHVFAAGAKGELAPGSASTVRGATMPALLALNPAAQPGLADVVVSGPFGSSKLWPAFLYADSNPTQAKLLGITPTFGPTTGGNDAWLLAALPAGTAVTGVQFGSKSALFVQEGGQIRASVPAHPAGVVDVTLQTSAGALTLPAAYRFEPALGVQKVTPAVGPTSGGTQVVLAGKGLSAQCSVRVGLYGATVLNAGSDGKQLTIETPEGPAGPADVVVRCGGQQATLPGGFGFTDGAPRINAVLPPTGATGGNTKVTIYGAGFDKGVQFLFGGKAAFACTLVSSGVAQCQTPPHPAGVVAVDVVLGKQRETLLNGYNYFNPTQPEGGTWGETVGGVLNVTVVDIYTLEPIDNATVQLGSPGDALFDKYKGQTDQNGQVVFAGPDIVGPIRVSAAKTQYSASSIIDFDATNATLLLFPWVPPSNGNGGGGGPVNPNPPAAIVRGKVMGIDKYLQVPPSNCTQSSTTDATCQTCEQDADCMGVSALGQAFRCVDNGSAGKRCLALCGGGASGGLSGAPPANTGCQSGFVCVADASLAQAAGPLPQVCKPTRGIVKVFCAPTVRSIEDNGQLPMPSADKNGGALEFPTDTVDEVTGEFELNTRLDELAVQCIGGYVDNQTKQFVPLALGVRRHIFPKPYYGPDDAIENQDVYMTMSLSRQLKVRVDRPQKAWKGVKGTQLVQSWIDLGSDGYVRLPRYAPVLGDVVQQTVFDDVVLPYHPLRLSSDLDDADWTFYTHVTYGGTVDAGPITLTLHQDAPNPGDDNLRLRGVEGVSQTLAIGTAQTLGDVLSGEGDQILLLGDRGELWRGPPQDPTLFWMPPVVDPYAPQLVTLAMSGTPTDATIVGELGLIRRLQGSKVAQEKGALTEDLVDVCVGPLGRVAIGKEGGLQADVGAGWQALQAASGPLKAVACTSQGAVAVGESGLVVSLDLVSLTRIEQTVSTAHLRAIAAAPDGELLLAGDAPAGDGPVLLRKVPGGLWQPAWPAGAVISAQRDLRVVQWLGEASWLLIDREGGQLRIDAAGLHDESPLARHLRPRASARLPDGRVVLVGEPGLWLGPFLTVPDIVSPAGAGVTEPLQLTWTQAPGPKASFSRVHVTGSGFPFWWLYVNPEVSDVLLPNFLDYGIDVFPSFGSQSMMVTVDRGYVPGFSINGFGTFDLEFGTWMSRASNSRTFAFP